MNQKVADARIEKGNNLRDRLMKLHRGILCLLHPAEKHATKAFVKKLNNLTKEIEGVLKHLQKKILEVTKEIERIEETRELTVQEEQEYIEQFSDIFKDGEEKTEKLEEALNLLVN